MKKSRLLGAVCAFLTILSFNASATLVFIDHSARGSYFNTNPSVITHAPDNYTVGLQDPSVAYQNFFRNYFVFDLGVGITDTITGANIRIYNPIGAFVGLQNAMTLDMWSYEGAVGDLITGNAGLAGWNDLGSGLNYGQVVIAPTDEGVFIDIALNASFISDLQNASGLFAIGGKSSAETTGARHTAFWGTNSAAPATHLLLTTQAAVVPIPAAAWLFGSGLLGLVGMARRKQA